MAKQITLTNVANLQETTTAQTSINGNNATITSAFTDVLSLSGVQPNQMLSNLDMNSYPVINVGSPVSSSSAVRLQDLADIVANGTITINNSVTNNSLGIYTDQTTAAAATIPSDVEYLVVGGFASQGDGGQASYYKITGSIPSGQYGFTSTGGINWVIADVDINIMALGAVQGSSNATVTTAAINNAIALQVYRQSNTLPAGRIIIPSGNWYVTPVSGHVAIEITTQGLIIQGSGAPTTTIQVVGNNNLITVLGSYTVLRDITWSGYNGTDAAYPTIILGYGSPIGNNAQSTRVLNCNIQYGTIPLSIQTGDVIIDECYITAGFLYNVYVGTTVQPSGAQAWLRKVKIDQAWPYSAPTYNETLNNWTSGNSHSVGDIVLAVSNGLTCMYQCTIKGSGTSTQDPNQNSSYGFYTLSDGYQWALAAPEALIGIFFDTNSFQSKMEQCDLSGSYSFCMQLDGTLSGQPASATTITDCSFGDGPLNGAIYAHKGAYLQVSGCEFTGQASNTFGCIYVGSGWSGPIKINNNQFYGSTYYQTTGMAINLAAGDGALISDNVFGPYSLTAINVGTVNDVTIIGNRFISCYICVTFNAGSTSGTIMTLNNFLGYTGTAYANSATQAHAYLSNNLGSDI